MQNFTLIFFMLASLLGGCYPKSLEYKIGLGTRWIEGTVLEENGILLKSKKR